MMAGRGEIDSVRGIFPSINALNSLVNTLLPKIRGFPVKRRGKGMVKGTVYGAEKGPE